jgi:glutathione S-transferase
LGEYVSINADWYNGVKVSIMLEEIGLPDEPPTVDTGKNETWIVEFLLLKSMVRF